MKIGNKIQWTKDHMPVMAKIAEEFERSKPFSGLTIGACLHLTKETAILLLALKNGGAKVVACASNPLSTQDDVADYLRDYGMTIYGKKGMNHLEYERGFVKLLESNCDYLIDDGGDLTKAVHNSFMGQPDKTPLPKGGLEQTTTGVNRIKQMNLKYPILAVNDADTKHLFDNVYGTGQSTLDGIIRATNILLAGKTFVVAGYGNCGKGLAQKAKGMGCTVIVTEIDPIKALQAKMDGFEVMPMNDAVYIGDVFVTVTGNKDVITEKHLYHMKNGAIVANSGHFDVEIAMDRIKEHYSAYQISDDMVEYEVPYPDEGLPSKHVIILSDGRLVNLAAAEGHPSEVMDMSFANQALGLEYLIKMNWKIAGVYDVPIEIDRKVAELKAECMGVKYDTETEIQINYKKL